MFHSLLPSMISICMLLLSLTANGSYGADLNTAKKKTHGTLSNNNATKATDTNTCTLYMASSSIPQAGYGIFTTKSFDKYSTILSRDGPNIAVIDPYLIPSSHTAKFDDVWWAEGNGMPDEMKYEGEIVVDYQIMLGALPNYHPYLYNIMNVPHPKSDVYQDDWNEFPGNANSGSSNNRGPGAGAFTYYQGKRFAAGYAIEAGDELFLDYGTNWLESRKGDYDHVPRNDDYVKAGEILLTLLKDWNLENDMDDLFSSNLSSSVHQHEPRTNNNTDKIDQILTHTRRICSEIFDVPRVSSLIPENEQQLKQVLLHVYNKEAAKNTCTSNDTKMQKHCNSELPSKDMADWATAEDLAFAIAHELTVNRRSVEWIHENGICVDNIVAGPSTIQDAGRGARAQRRIAKGEIIVPVPLLHIMDREALRTHPVTVTPEDEIDDDDNDVDDQGDDTNGDGIVNDSAMIDDNDADSQDSFGDDSTTDDNDDESTPLQLLLQRDYSKTHKQLLLNYCFGHEMSSLLLCPVTNAILINHCSDRKDSRHPCGTRGGGPNAKYQWASNPKWDTKTSNWLNKTLEEMQEAKDWRLLSMEIVATRDIEAGEEIFMDYGPKWEEAWNNHLESWEQPESGSGFEYHVSASKLNQEQGPIIASNDLINEYGFSTDVFTACWYWQSAEEWEREYDHDEDFDDGWKDLDDEEIMSRYGENGHYFIRHSSTFDYGEFWPCSVIHKNDDSNAENSPKDDSTYTVRIYPSKTIRNTPKWHRRGLPRFLTDFPRKSIQYFTKPYRSDQHLPGAFRHHIEINDDIFPEQWKNRKPGWNSVDVNNTFKKGDRVLANYLGRGRWFKATIEKAVGNNRYDVVYTDDSTVERDLNESFIKKSDWVTTPVRHLGSSLYL